MKINQITAQISQMCIVLGTFSTLHAGNDGAGDELSPAGIEEPANNGNWLSPLLDGQHRLDLEVEQLNSDDIEITQYALQYELKQPLWDTALTLGYVDYAADYRPAVIGSNTQLNEQTRSIQARVGWKLNARWNVDVTARHYDGFAGYRSVWIAEYYRQLFGGLPTYQEPDPKGESYSAGVTYTYLPGHSVRASVGYGRDTIAPGFSIGATGVNRSRPNLYRKSVTLRLEDVWTEWLKSEGIINYVDTTNRSARWSIKSTWHVALSDDWTLRLNAGYAEEDPDFDSMYSGLAIEWEFAPKWYLSLNMDIYKDSGEIPNAGLVTTAAPGLETLQYGIGLRWVGEHSAFKVYAAVYENDYDALSASNQIFRNLYQDRDWALVQVSYTHNF